MSNLQTILDAFAIATRAAYSTCHCLPARLGRCRLHPPSLCTLALRHTTWIANDSAQTFWVYRPPNLSLHLMPSATMSNPTPALHNLTATSYTIVVNHSSSKYDLHWSSEYRFFSCGYSRWSQCHVECTNKQQSIQSTCMSNVLTSNSLLDLPAC